MNNNKKKTSHTNLSRWRMELWGAQLCKLAEWPRGTGRSMGRRRWLVAGGGIDLAIHQMTF